MLIDFDRIEQWEANLNGALSQHLSSNIATELAAAQLEFVEDALDVVFRNSDRERVIEATLGWLTKNDLAAYHGTRLSDEELQSLKLNGFTPLTAEHRRERLLRSLAKHPNWSSEKCRFEETLEACGTGARFGRRENQVHFTLSKAGLISGFNHYLAYGSEFDQRVAQCLFGKSGLECLNGDGAAYLIKVNISGVDALKAAHPFMPIESMRKRGDLPNIVSPILKAWSFRSARTSFNPEVLKIDCGLIFFEPVLANAILDITSISESNLIQI